MAFASLPQEDFSLGIYRGRKAPASSLYDSVNALINDEGLPFRRGGSAYKSNADAGSTLLGIFEGFLSAGSRTLFWSATDIWTLASDDATPVQFTTPVAPPNAGARGAVVDGVLFLSCSDGLQGLFSWGGSRKPDPDQTTSTVTFTNGSAVITASGTSWSTKYEAGTIVTSGTVVATVKTVDSNTQITLAEPWTGASGAASATLYNWAVNGNFGPHFPVAVGSPPRLLWSNGSKVYYTGRGAPNSIDLATDYHQFGESAVVIGSDSIQDEALFFTTLGVWAISNLSFDDVDAFGNIQHSVAQINKDVILWGDAGVTGWAGGFVVPAVDDVYVLAPNGQSSAISGALRPLYRAHVQAGYRPGLATVHRGHYFLPILDGSTVVDSLVCRLDREGTPWVRWAGHAAALGFTQRVGSTTRAPKLLGVQGERVLDLTGTIDPTSSNAEDADGTTSDLVITTRDFPTGQQPGFVDRARLRYELTDDGDGGTTAPTVALAFSSDQDAGVFTSLTENGLQGGGTGGATSDGSKYSFWKVRKKRERLRLRITVAGASASFILRSIELLTRQSGKQ